MNYPDLINGLFESFGVFAVWGNVLRLKRDKDVKGIVWQFTIVYWLWGLYNCFYYPWLHQWFSFSAGLVLCIGNGFWLYHWINILLARNHSLNKV